MCMCVCIFCAKDESYFQKGAESRIPPFRLWKIANKGKAGQVKGAGGKSNKE